MKTILLISCFLCIAMVSAAAAEGVEPIKEVKIGANREFLVNGRPFFPLGSWAQANRNYPLLRSVGINTFVGGSGDVLANLKAAKAVGGYHVAGFDKAAIGNPYLLGWIHSDEPDLLADRQDLELTSATMRPHNLRRLGRMFDGNNDTKAVLEPLEGLEFTARWPKSVSVVKFRIRLGSAPIAVKDIELIGDGKPLAKAALQRNTTWQEIPLARPATFRSLTVKIPTIYPGEGQEGACHELEGLATDGVNVLAAPVRKLPRYTPGQVLATYRRIRQADPSRPIFMTLTSGFMKSVNRPEAVKKMYPEFIAATDVVGFDFYPIYGWNRLEWITRPGEGTAELRKLAGPAKPVYAFIETSKGSRWITYSKQHDVLGQHTRAEVWMSIIEGATGIFYFTHAWRPEFTEFAPTEQMRAELKRLNGQITRLGPAILAAPATATIEIAFNEKLAGHLKATQLDGAIWIFAQNIEVRQADGKTVFPEGTATIRVQGLKAGTIIDVIDENRTITAGDGEFSDAFDALAEHIYRIQR